MTEFIRLCGFDGLVRQNHVSIKLWGSQQLTVWEAEMSLT